MKRTSKRSSRRSKALPVCLSCGDSVHHIDHLAPMVYMMEMPILTDDSYLFEVVEKYYPQIKAFYISHRSHLPACLASRYDVLFTSSANCLERLSPLFQTLFNKKMQFWYCPHGNSDKSMECLLKQMMLLIYGDQMEERLKNQEVLPTVEGYVKTGNCRFSFYKKYQDFYDLFVEEEVFSGFKKKQTTILYAPTWQDQENSSSFFEVCTSLIDQLPNSYNLIVKLHPWIERGQLGYITWIREKYQNRPNVVILTHYPLVLPILKRTDLYLGDFSSIGYDFLDFNRPMFFFDGANKKSEERAPASPLRSCPLRSCPLRSCGVQIPKLAYGNIYSFIEKTMHQQEGLKEKRAALYHYAFGKMRDFDEVRKEIEALF